MTQSQRSLTNRLVARLGEVRTDWSLAEVRELFALPFADLLFHAQRVHRANFDPNEVQVSTLLSIKTGACPEDCAYCSQSIRFETGLKSEPLLDLEEVLAKARIARANGATRFCMGAAYRSPKPKQLAQIAAMIKAVRELGMETCATLGMLTPEQARELKDAGLDYYNHNLDTSESHYGKVITTRTYQDRLDTLQAVRDAGINVCCGGILGLGEDEQDRAKLLHTLATLPQHPESVPRHASVWRGEAEAPRLRTRDRSGAAAHAGLVRAALGGPQRDERRDAGAVFSGGRELDLLRRDAADDRESLPAPRPRAVRAARDPRRAAHARRGRTEDGR
jgi:biotin synthase